MVEKLINNQLTSTKGFEDIYPFESKFMKINGHDLHYIDKGEGRPVILIHGNPTWSFYYRHLIQTLSKDFRTLAFDHIGCGLSDKPDTETYDYTLKSRIENLDTFIASLDIKEKISLVVHDWGGMIGLAWAVDHIDSIDRIIITNTSGFLLPKEKQFPFALWFVKYIRFFAVPAVLGLNLFARSALYFCTAKKLSSKARKGLVTPYNSWKNRIATLKFVQDIPVSTKDPGHAVVNHVDKHLHLLNEHDLMFLWGTRDFVFDIAFLNEFRRRFPWAETHTFHDAGHYLFEDKPEETAAMIQKFLHKKR